MPELSPNGKGARASAPHEPALASIGSDLCCAWRGPVLLAIPRHVGTLGGQDAGAGFYAYETRHLKTLRFEINGSPPWLCEAAEEDANHLVFTYIHPEMTEFGGGGSGQARDERSRDASGLPHRSLEIELRYTVALNRLDVSLNITNRCSEDVQFTLRCVLGADFADMLGASSPSNTSASSAARVESVGQHLRLSAPQGEYATLINVAATHAWKLEDAALALRFHLAPRQVGTLTLNVRPESSLGIDDADAADRERLWEAWRQGLAQISTPGNTLAQRIITRHVEDFAALPLMDGARDEWLTMQAGVPLYPALFGRDALTAGWQAAMLDRGTALDATLTRLGRLQGTVDDPERDEEPGRIVQQVRHGPRSRSGFPFARYYGDFASPFMYVISLAHLYAWTGDKDQLRRHWDTARRILDWARERGDRDGDGYVEYLTKSDVGATHQGWKDSGDAIVHRDGSLARAPIATCELQAYWYAAQQMTAILSWALGSRAEALDYWKAAQELKERFNRDWWDEEDELPLLALDADKRPVRSPSSNAGHCLACGILDDEKLGRTVGRLFRPDMFSGWGIRTLSSDHIAYDPLSYHRGSVWAVENATIAFGLRRFGFDARALELAKAMFDLAALYRGGRIPETVGGHGRGERATPGLYPRSNPIQLWNASAMPLLVHVIVGLQPVAPLDLLVVDPALPSWLPEVVIHDLKLGGASASLRFWRDKHGASHVEIVRHRGTLRLVRQPPPESQTHGWRDRFSALADRLLHH